jgi:DNA-binding MarR family transcriptional regulator
VTAVDHELLEYGGDPFTMVPDALLFDPEVTDGALRLWMTVKTHARSKAMAWPGIDSMGDRLGWSPSTVKRHLQALTAAGWVKRRRRFGTSSRTFLCASKGQEAPWERTSSDQVTSDPNGAPGGVRCEPNETVEQVRSEPSNRSDLSRKPEEAERELATSPTDASPRDGDEAAIESRLPDEVIATGRAHLAELRSQRGARHRSRRVMP